VNARTDPFHEQRGRLLGLAYRMLGSRADAEDVVQDAWLKWANAGGDNVKTPEAFLVTIVTRLCLDRLKSARAQREIYVGPWLPEPIGDADALSPHSATELADDLSFALLLALERLSPLERAAFLLHDVFDAPFCDVAETLDRSEAAVRQLAARARSAVRNERPAHRATPDSHARLLAAFVEATGKADITQLKTLLREDVVALSDGGGKRPAALNPIRGADRVARFIQGVLRKQRAAGHEISSKIAEINGAPGAIIYLDGAFDQTLTLSIEDDRIAALYIVRNPDKLGAIAPENELPTRSCRS
jgi:RNA polymerase sigma-70 factor (ECF subfamily)